MRRPHAVAEITVVFPCLVALQSVAFQSIHGGGNIAHLMPTPVIIALADIRNPSNGRRRHSSRTLRSNAARISLACNAFSTAAAQPAAAVG